MAEGLPPVEEPLKAIAGFERAAADFFETFPPHAFLMTPLHTAWSEIAEEFRAEGIEVPERAPTPAEFALVVEEARRRGILGRIIQRIHRRIRRFVPFVPFAGGESHPATDVPQPSGETKRRGVKMTIA